MNRVAIIAALPGELKPLVRGWQSERLNGVDLWRRSFLDEAGEANVWIAACAGAGEKAAERAFVEVERIFAIGETAGSIDLVISVGWAGALSEELAPGRAYSVCGVIDTCSGERFHTVASDPEKFWLATSSRVADEQEKQRLAATFGAGLVDMEAAGVARLALAREASFYCVKGISDGYKDKLPDFNYFISKNGQFELARFVVFVLLRPWYWPALIRMGENSKRAAQSIAAALFDFLDERGSTKERNG